MPQAQDGVIQFNRKPEKRTHPSVLTCWIRHTWGIRGPRSVRSRWSSHSGASRYVMRGPGFCPQGDDNLIWRKTRVHKLTQHKDDYNGCLEKALNQSALKIKRRKCYLRTRRVRPSRALQVLSSTGLNTPEP